MPTDRRELVIFGAVGLGAAVAGAVLGPLLWQSQSGVPELLSSSFPDLSGKPHKILEFQPRALLANFWATWCEPCREEVPLLIAAHDKFSASGLLVLGIGIDSAEKLKRFAADYGIAYPVLVADAGALELMRKLGNPVGGLPFTVGLDTHGRVAHRRLGPIRKGELDAIVPRMLR